MNYWHHLTEDQLQDELNDLLEYLDHYCDEMDEDWDQTEYLVQLAHSKDLEAYISERIQNVR